MEVIVGRRGNQPFAITDMSVSGKHLKLTLLADDTVAVEDLGSSNGTFVDGVRIIKKVVKRDTRVRMGSAYSFCVGDAFPKNMTSQTPPTATEYSIRHLENVWNNYATGLEELSNKNKTINIVARISSVFTIGGGVLGGILRTMEGLQDLSNISLIASGLGLIIMVYSIAQSYTFDYNKEKKKLDEQFEKDYICPNPECRHFLGYTKYSILRQDKQCRYCRGKYKE